MTDETTIEPDDTADAAATSILPATATSTAGDQWWRSAVIYQVYPRSFADTDGDGIGDLPGIRAGLPHLASLGVDAVWLSPFFTSPQKDAGYDVADYTDVDPLFGTLADADSLIADAHELGLRIIVDLVPNHSSDQHPWFQAALAAAPRSPERARYLFRDGRGAHGELPPNNWQSVFGGDAWTRITEPDGRPGQWYLHLFDASQPDFDWTNEEVRQGFRDILRFWLDHGVDGFRVDVAHGMVKAAGLPDVPEGGGADAASLDPDAMLDEASMSDSHSPYWAQEGVHEIFRDWRRVLDEYEGERILVAEAWVAPLTRLAGWVRPDEMHQAFNFSYLAAPWSASILKRTIDGSLAAFGGVGAPSTWVLSNHDVVRHATRLAMDPPVPQGDGVGPDTPGVPPYEAGLRRARAATALMLALPGSAYLYQGEELGLPEVVDLPPESRQDPTWARTHHEKYGRDGCRVPIPWEQHAPAYGFSPSGSSWLPQPPAFGELARDRQAGAPGSTLELYRTLLALRAEWMLGLGSLEWLPGFDASVLAFRNNGMTVIANVGTTPVELPTEGEIVVASADVVGGILEPDVTVWIA